MKEKCLAVCALLFISFAFMNHAYMVSILAALFILSLVIVKQQKISLDQPTKLLIFSFVFLFVFSIPNMVMDSLYVGKLKASSLDVPSRYLLGAIALIGLSQLRLKAKHLFIGNLIGIIVAFAIYPIFASYILELPRYFYKSNYSSYFTGVLSVAYMAISCMLTALISGIYFHHKKQKTLTLLAFFCANLASVVMVLSASKVVLIAYFLIPLLFLFTWRKTGSEIRWIMITPLITAIAFSIGKESLALCNMVLITPLIFTYLFSNNTALRLIRIYNMLSLIVVICISTFSVFYSQTDNGQQTVKKLTSSSKMLSRINHDLNTMNKANSTTLRIGMWKSAWASFKQSPFLGQGYEERKVFHNKFVKDEKLSKRLIIHKGKNSLHSEIMNALGKKGIIGFIAILVLYFIPISIFYRLQRKNENNYYIGLSGIFIVLSFMISGLTESLLMTTRMSSFFVISITLTYLTLDRYKTPTIE
jgi:O-antigen ligase